MLKEYENHISSTHRLLDVSLTIFAWYSAYVIRFIFLSNAERGLLEDFTMIAVGMSIITFYIFEKYNLYQSYRFKSVYYEITDVLKAQFVNFAILIFVLYFFRLEKLSRIHLVIFYLTSNIYLIALRIIKRNIINALRKNEKNLRYISIVGSGKQTKEFVKMVNGHNCGIKIKGWLYSNGENEKFDIKHYENEDELEGSDALVLGFGGTNAQRSEDDFLKRHYNNIVPIHLLPDLSYSLLGHEITDFDGVIILTVNEPNFSVIELIAKRTFDFFVSFFGLLLISPIMFMIMFGVKVSSSGPIFYGQERIGLNGRRFKMWKFRSMQVAKKNEDETIWTSKDDPRKTKFGSFIRKTSMDELPQLWNVLVGEMSLVGPRPERPMFVDKFKKEIPNYMLRHKMKAGITGWAQINGWRGDTDLKKRIEFDIYYIRHWSIFFDLKIFLLTFIRGFFDKNAY